MFDRQYYNSLEHGEERFNYLKKAIAEEDNAHNYELAFRLRYDYIGESVMHGDCYKGMIMFPEFMAYHDAHSDVCSTHDLMWAFKWMIEDALDFYQIPRDKIEGFFKEFRRRCEEYGISLRTYYMKLCTFYKFTAPEKIPECRKLYAGFERDDLSDCYACELSHDIQLELYYGSESKAMKMLSDLRSRGITCGKVPENTYAHCIRYFLEKGFIDEAEHYADMLLPMLKNKEEEFLFEYSQVLLLYAFTSPDKAYDIFKRTAAAFLENKNPTDRFYYAYAAAKFFSLLHQAGNNRIRINMPRSFKHYQPDGEYAIEDMKNYFSEIARDIADKLDGRNGTSFYDDIINFDYPAEPQGMLELPTHGAVPADHAAIAVLYRSQEQLPKPEKLLDSINALPDVAITAVDVNEERAFISITLDYSLIDETVEARLYFRGAQGIAEGMRPIHSIEDEILGAAAECEVMAVVTCKLLYGYEYQCYDLLLSMARAVDLDDSPVYLDLESRHILSRDWVKLQTQDHAPVPLKYLYNTGVYASETAEGCADVYSCGFNTFGARNFTLSGVEIDDLDFVIAVFTNIAESIINVSRLSDEGETEEFGAVYNNESQVRFSWRSAEAVYPDREDLKGLAVPYLHFSDSPEGVLPNEIPPEKRELIDFRDSNLYITHGNKRAKMRFKYALEAFNKYGGELYAVLELPLSEQYHEQYGDTAYVHIELDEGGKTGVITRGLDGVCDLSGADLSEGNRIAVAPESVISWLYQKDDERYDDDRTYILASDSFGD